MQGAEAVSFWLSEGGFRCVTTLSVVKPTQNLRGARVPMTSFRCRIPVVRVVRRLLLDSERLKAAGRAYFEVEKEAKFSSLFLFLGADVGLLKGTSPEGEGTEWGRTCCEFWKHAYHVALKTLEKP